MSVGNVLETWTSNRSGYEQRLNPAEVNQTLVNLDSNLNFLTSRVMQMAIEIEKIAQIMDDIEAWQVEAQDRPQITLNDYRRHVAVLNKINRATSGAVK